ncbi:MAG TPA: hypothetical protein VF841_14125 [Anaeromyxobacter sp.]
MQTTSALNRTISRLEIAASLAKIALETGDEQRAAEHLTATLAYLERDLRVVRRVARQTA